MGQRKMNEKLQESAQYLKCCNKLEMEAFKLYETFSKKINQPENCFILGIAYDSLKCAKIIQGILDYIDTPETEKTNPKKNFAELTDSVSAFTNKVSKINSIDNEVASEILKELVTLEDQLTEAYTEYLQSSSIRVMSDEFSKLQVNLDKFKKLFETFADEKQKHKETMIEITCYFDTRETERLRHAAPVVKYQNPDSWILASSLHSFSATTPETATS
jgi:hypothetical protein